MTINVEELRKKFPSPRRGGGPLPFKPETYCVGGALSLELAEQHGRCARNFPTLMDICFLLVEVTGLPRSDARYFADKIMTSNDEGNFDEAWAWMDKALSQ